MEKVNIANSLNFKLIYKKMKMSQEMLNSIQQHEENFQLNSMIEEIDSWERKIILLNFFFFYFNKYSKIREKKIMKYFFDCIKTLSYNLYYIHIIINNKNINNSRNIFFNKRTSKR